MSKLVGSGCRWEKDAELEGRIRERFASTPDTEFVGLWLDRKRQLSVLVSKDSGRWHLSIAHPRRYPSWDEVHAARYEFIPDEIYMMMGLPPKAVYVNVHDHCFHLWEAQELKTIWLMNQM